MMVKKYK